jgi:sugar phosphate isomerase/epimerase
VVGDDELIRQILRRLDDTGLSILDVEAVWLTPDTSVPNLVPALETAARLGARYLLIVGNDPEPARVTATLAGLAEAARPFGIKLMLEFIPYCATSTFQEAQRLIAAAAQPNVGVLVDTLHLTRSGGTPADLQDAPGLDYVQFCDAALERPAQDQLRTEARTQRFYPGEGQLDLHAFLNALPPNTPLALEAPCDRDAHLSPIERAQRCGAATRRFLEGRS